jgi:hypothetical protein
MTVGRSLIYFADCSSRTLWASIFPLDPSHTLRRIDADTRRE